MNEILNHLLQSTLFAAAVGVVNTTLRRNSPRLRYWLWLTASLKFLVPFSLLVSTGARIQLPPDTPSLHAVTVQQISTYVRANVRFSGGPCHLERHCDGRMALAAIWLAGALFLVLRWFHRWRTIHSAVRRATHLPFRISVPARFIDLDDGAGVFGVFRPVLVLPEGIADNLRRNSSTQSSPTNYVTSVIATI